MGDYSWARIDIGGTLKKKKVKEFLEMLETEGLDSQLPGDQLEWLKELWKSSDHSITFEDDQVRGGEFSDLEEWLRKNEMPFDRICASCAGVWDSEEVHYRPGYDGISYAVLSNDGHAMIEQAAVQAIINDPKNNTRSRLAKALESRMIKNVPELPPFRVEGPYPTKSKE